MHCKERSYDVLFLRYKEQGREFFVILVHVLPFYPTKKSKLWKGEKNTLRHYYFIHMYHKWQSHDVQFLRYGAWLTRFFLILGHFCCFTTITMQKIKILKKRKKNKNAWRYYPFTHVSFFTKSLYSLQGLWSNWDFGWELSI